jgi:alpha-mannosidase
MTSPDNVLENGHLRAVINANGTIDLTHKASGRTFTGLHVLIDKGDAGDEYSYSWPEHDEIIRSTEFPCRIRKIEDSPVRVAYEISTVMRLPASATKDFKGRSKKRIANPARTVVSLGRTARRLEFATTVENNSKDHTLRAAFPTGLRTASSFAEMPFDVTERPIAIEHPPKEAWIEEPATTHPQGTFCYLTDAKVSFAVLNRGLPGYDAPDEPDRRIELTLLRSVGCIARGELLTRRMFLLPVETPGAYCLGPNTYEYAVTVVENEDRGALALEAHAFNAGLRAMESDKRLPHEPGEVSFVKLSPTALVCTAVKRSEDGKLLVVRCYNATNEPVQGRLELHWPIKKAWHLAPSEAKRSEIRDLKGRAVRFKAGRKQIVTLGLQLDGRPAAKGR